MEDKIDFRVLGICNAYESGFGQHDRDLVNPYAEGSDESRAYRYGKEIGAERGYKPHSSDSIQAEWLPIDTAPKDHSWILITDGQRRYLARWESINRRWEAWPMSAVPGRMTHWTPAPALLPNV